MTMYKLLIVDDEKIIRNTLADTLPWGNYGISEVLQAQNGEIALDLVEKYRPQIILTDIKMPGIDGLELSSIVKERFSNIVIIVLSGYDEFSLVKKAMNIGVLDYVLKPVCEDEMERVMKKAVDCVDRNMEEDIREKLINQEISRGNNALKTKLFTELVTNSYVDSESAFLQLSKLDTKLTYHDYFMVVFYLTDANKEFFTKSGFDLELLTFGLINIIEEVCSRLTPNFGTFTCLDYNIALVIEGYKSDSDEIKDFIKKIHGHIRDFINTDIITGVSANYHSGREIKVSFEEAYEQSVRKDYYGSDAEVKIEDSGIMQNALLAKKQNILRENIYACNAKQADAVIDEIYDTACRFGIPVVQIKIINAFLLNDLLDLSEKLNSDLRNVLGSQNNLFKKLEELKNLKSSKNFMKETAGKLISLISARNAAKKKKVINGILTYIENNYNQEITLYALADKFDVEYTNLSKMFKEDVGELFSKYLIDLRINKAKKFLLHSEMKVYEIGNLVGYNDVKYFTRLFKESEGVTPMVFKKGSGGYYAD
jgi:two-component system response regulator YesN